MTYNVTAFTTVSIEADSIEQAKQLLKDKADRYGHINLSQSTSNDNGYIFVLTTIYPDSCKIEAL